MNKINLISLSSPAGGGKDLVTFIIQSLNAWEESTEEFQREYETVEDYIIDCISNPNLYRHYSKWQNKKFAYKLKQMLGLLIGKSVEWIEENKDVELGEEWAIWKVDSSYNEYRKIKCFSEYSIAEDYYNFINDENTNITKIIPTVRLALQLIGTEVFRDTFHRNTWTNALFADYTKDKCTPYCQKLSIANPDNGCTDMSECDYAPYWIISDSRFKNELQAVKNRGGITVMIDSTERLNILRVAEAERLAQIELMNESDDIFYQDKNGDYHLMNNSYQDKYTKLYNKYYNELEDNHASENDWKNWKFDYVIDNNKDLLHLIKDVEKFMKHYKL